MRRLILCCLISVPAFAAIDANTIWEIQPTIGSDTNGSGFTIGVGTKTVTAATDLAIDGTLNTKVTSATHNFVAGDVGKYLNITTGTNWSLGYYRIVSTASNAATLDRSPGAVSLGSGTYDLYDGIDYSDIGATPHVNIENSAITASCATNTLTLTAGYTTALTDVGNIVHLTATTGVTAGMYEITAVSAAAPPNGTWTLTGAQSACTAGPNTGVIGKMGGSSATFAGVISIAGGGYVASNTVFVKATGTVSVSATTTFSVSVVPSISVPYTRIRGYSTTRGDGGQVTVQSSNGSYIFTPSGGGISISNFVLDCNNVAACSGINNGGLQNVYRNVTVKRFKTRGMLATGVIEVYDSEFTGSTACTDVLNLSTINTFFERINIHDNACIAITSTANTSAFVLLDSIISKNSGASSDSLSITCRNAVVVHNTFDAPGRSNVRCTEIPESFTFRNNVLANPDGAGVNLTFSVGAGTAWSRKFDGNCYWKGSGSNYGNTADEGATNPINGVYPERPTFDVITTADPFVDGSTNNFALNNAAGAGAACRNAGIPGTFLGGSSTGYFDMGAVQTQTGATPGTLSSTYVQ